MTQNTGLSGFVSSFLGWRKSKIFEEVLFKIRRLKIGKADFYYGEFKFTQF